MAMTKSKIVAGIADGVGVSKKQATAALETLVKLAYKNAKDGFTVPGLGKLVIRNTPKRPAREGRNPATGDTIKIPAKPAGKKLVFRVAKAAKLAVLKK